VAGGGTEICPWHLFKLDPRCSRQRHVACLRVCVILFGIDDVRRLDPPPLPWPQAKQVVEAAVQRVGPKPRAARRFRPAGDETVSSVAAIKERSPKGGLSMVNEDLKHPVSGGVARSAWMAPQAAVRME